MGGRRGRDQPGGRDFERALFQRVVQHNLSDRLAAGFDRLVRCLGSGGPEIDAVRRDERESHAKPKCGANDHSDTWPVDLPFGGSLAGLN